ncbi:MAG: DUF6544 family protein [Bacteroidota bacterium]
MLRYFLAFLLFAHGLIHVLGFVKAFGIAPVEQLSQDISKPVGIFWLACALVLITAGIIFLFKNNVWWAFAALAIVPSQILIISSWSDAKFGTLANILLLVPALLAFGEWNSMMTAKDELRAFLPAFKSKQQPKIITQEDIAHMPPVVQKWLERSNIVGKTPARVSHLRQRGAMRTKPGGDWMPFTAEQYFTAVKPGFYWTADVGNFFLNFKGRDMYRDGHGNMLIKAYSLVPVADAKGKEIDQGTMLRFMAEMVWTPSVALKEYITWEQLDERRAKATMKYGFLTVSGIFTFTLQGDMQCFDAERYYDRNGRTTLENWHIDADPTGFKTFQDIRIPARSTVTWKLGDGDFQWLKMEITDAEYQ